MLLSPSGHPLNFAFCLLGVFHILPLAWICLFVHHGSPIGIVEGGAIYMISLVTGRTTTRTCAFWHTCARLLSCLLSVAYLLYGWGRGRVVVGGVRGLPRHALSMSMAMAMALVFACDVGAVGGHVVNTAVRSWLRIIGCHCCTHRTSTIVTPYFDKYSSATEIRTSPVL